MLSLLVVLGQYICSARLVKSAEEKEEKDQRFSLVSIELFTSTTLAFMTSTVVQPTHDLL